MSKSQNTPGPWVAAERGDYGDYEGNSRVILGNDRRIAVVQHHGTDEDEANTHLIEAALDMHDAIDQALDDMADSHCVCEATKQMLRAALAKASMPD